MKFSRNLGVWFFASIMTVLVSGGAVALACGKDGCAAKAKDGACPMQHSAANDVFVSRAHASEAAAGKIEKAQLDVKGMMCSSCVEKVAGAVKNINGVQEISVEHKKDLVVVSYNPEKATVNAIVKAITDIGFEAVAKN